jgi:hypothetical protein
MVKPKRMRWTGYVAGMRIKRNSLDYWWENEKEGGR